MAEPGDGRGYILGEWVLNSLARYADNPIHKYILSNGGMFLLNFAAACGKLRADGNMGLGARQD
jgi:hypothetical protein